MRDLMAKLKELRLHGMTTAWAESIAQGESVRHPLGGTC